MKHRSVQALLCASALGAAYGVKRHYATASADDLHWVLAPTAWLVSALTGETFTPEARVGFVSTTLGTAIVPACAGLNFFAIAATLLVLAFTRRLSRTRLQVAWFAASYVIAYAATLAVNAVRITIGIALRGGELGEWMTSDAAHRAEGVVVYLVSLCTLYHAVDAGLGGIRRQRSSRWPVLAYLAGACVVPLLNRGYARPETWAHVALVLAVTAAVCTLLAAARVARAGSRSAKREPLPT